MDTSGTVTVFMPDGRMDVYTPNGLDGFASPYQVFNTLVLISGNHYELNLPDGTVYVYSIPAGTSSQQPFLTAIRDAYGNTLDLGYNSNVQLTTITDAQGDVYSLTYNSSGLVTNVADPFGRNAIFQYDTNKNLIQITDMGGYWSSFTYDTNIFLNSISDERGTWRIKTEPADGIVNGSNPYPAPGTAMWQNYRVTITDPLGQPAEYQYDGYSYYSWYISPRDYVRYSSASLNNYSSAAKTRYNFITAGSGHWGEFSQITYPAGDYIQYGYDTSTGDRTSVTDSHSPAHTTRSTYNSVGRVTSTTDTKTNTTTFTYATNGVDLLSVSNGLGQILMAYNAQHDLVSLSDRLTNTTTFAYKTNGQILLQVDALGITNEFIYDASQRLAEFRRAGQSLERFTYDAAGRVRTRTDATGLTVTNDYDNLNQVVRVTYPDGRFETYTYSTCCPHLLDSVTDRGGRTTTFIHDVLKRLVQTINPEGGITQFGYDANGNRTSLTDQNGNITTFSYDLDNRLTTKAYADGKGLTFRYDNGGLLTNQVNGRGISTTYAYDANSHLTTSDGPWVDDTITYTFDALGRRTNLLVQGSQPTGYDYDALNRLKDVRVGAQTYAYTYASGNPLAQRLDRPNGSFTTYQYDGFNRLTALSNRRSTSEVIKEFLYAYSGQDLRASETVSNGPTLTFTNQFVTYDYNRLNQLFNSSPQSQVFVCDDDGNMTGGVTPEGLQFVAIYDAENRLKSVTVTTNGSVVARREYLYTWNSFAAQIKYEQLSQGTNQLRQIREGNLVLQDRDSDNNVIREFTWPLVKDGGIGGLLGLKQAGETFSYTYDGKGNVVTVLDAAQTAGTAYRYDEFGVLVASVGSLDQRQLFSTKQYDSTLGFLDFGYRQYMPSIGRWLTRDPMGEVAGANLYAYVGNNPISNNDPLGLCEKNHCEAIYQECMRGADNILHDALDRVKSLIDRLMKEAERERKLDEEICDTADNPLLRNNCYLGAWGHYTMSKEAVGKIEEADTVTAYALYNVTAAACAADELRCVLSGQK